MERVKYMNDIYSTNFSPNGQINIYDELGDFEKLRISALRKAAEISPLVTEMTIGPNSPSKNDKMITDKIPNINNEEPVDLIEDKIGEDLRYTLLLKEYESKLQEDSEDLFKNMVEKMITSYTETMHTNLKKQNDKWKCKSLELRARKLQMAKQLQENDNLNVLEKTKLNEKCQLINSQTIENMNKLLEEQNKATLGFASITDSRTSEMTSLAQCESPVKEALDMKYIPAINTVTKNIGTVMDCCATYTISDTEVKQVEILSLNMDNVKEKLLDEDKAIKQQELERIQKDEEMKRMEIDKKRAEAARLAEQAKLQQARIAKLQNMFYSDKNYAYYNHLRQFLEAYESKYKGLLDNINLKKFRFDCQKAVNTPVNAISSVSGLHMKDKYNKLAKLLRGERVQVLDTFVTASQHPQGLFYCTALLAKKIVRQGELLVSSNPDAAFPLAAITVALWSQFPDFGKLLEAYFHRHCPYLVPMLLPHKEGQTDKEFYMSRGYTYNDEGQVEKQDKFLKRMSGIFKLRCAIWIAKTPRFLNSSNPHGLSYGWQWLSSFINLKPEPDISATLLLDFFTICGSDFLKYYRNQFVKIIKLVSSEYIAILRNIDEGGPKTRLEVFLQDVLISGHISPPTDCLPPNMW